MAKASENIFPKVQFSEEAAPATPSAGAAVIYVQTAGKIYLKDDGGTETDLTGAGAGGGSDWSPILDVKSSADDPPDDEFDDSSGMSGATNGLDAKWTAVSGSELAVDLIETGNVSKYDLDTRAGWLLIQCGANTSQIVELRQDYTLADGKSIIAAIALGVTDPENIANNEFRVGVGVNNNDGGYTDGTSFHCGTEMDAGEPSISVWDEGTGGYGKTPYVTLDRLFYLRIARDGDIYYGFVSSDGATWLPLGFRDMTGNVSDNVWLFAEVGATLETPVPILAVRWIRLGDNTIDPW